MRFSSVSGDSPVGRRGLCLSAAGVAAVAVVLVALSTSGGPRTPPAVRDDRSDPGAPAAAAVTDARASPGLPPGASPAMPASRSGTIDLAAAIARFRDPASSFVDRRRAAFRLARNASPEALAVLMEALGSATPAHGAWLVQLMGATGGSAARALLWPLVDGPDERLAAAAIRGLRA